MLGILLLQVTDLLGLVYLVSIVGRSPPTGRSNVSNSVDLVGHVLTDLVDHFLSATSSQNFKKFLNAREGGGRTGPGHGESGGLQAVQRPAAFDVDHHADPHDQGDGDAAHDASDQGAIAARSGQFRHLGA